MKLAPVLVTPPAATPVTLAEAKGHCRVDGSDDDAQIQQYLNAAVGHLDGRGGILGRCIMEQTWSIALRCWPTDRCIRLPFCDIHEDSVEVKYSDASNVEQTLDPALYDLHHDAAGGFLWLKNAFSGPTYFDDRLDPIRITFDAGMDEDSPGLAAIRSAILLLVGNLYENREDVVVGQSLFVAGLPFGVDALIAPWRRVGV